MIIPTSIYPNAEVQAMIAPWTKKVVFVDSAEARPNTSKPSQKANKPKLTDFSREINNMLLKIFKTYIQQARDSLFKNNKMKGIPMQHEREFQEELEVEQKIARDTSSNPDVITAKKKPNCNQPNKTQRKFWKILSEAYSSTNKICPYLISERVLCRGKDTR